MKNPDFTLSRLRVVNRLNAALLCMKIDDLSGAEKRAAEAIKFLQEAQRLKDKISFIEMVTN